MLEEKHNKVKDKHAKKEEHLKNLKYKCLLNY
jgi:hypothetical protein